MILSCFFLFLFFYIYIYLYYYHSIYDFSFRYLLVFFWTCVSTAKLRASQGLKRTWERYESSGSGGPIQRYLGPVGHLATSWRIWRETWTGTMAKQSWSEPRSHWFGSFLQWERRDASHRTASRTWDKYMDHNIEIDYRNPSQIITNTTNEEHALLQLTSFFLNYQRSLPISCLWNHTQDIPRLRSLQPKVHLETCLEDFQIQINLWHKEVAWWLDDCNMNDVRLKALWYL